MISAWDSVIESSGLWCELVSDFFKWGLLFGSGFDELEERILSFGRVSGGQNLPFSGL